MEFKISAFCLTTNATKFGYAFIESIKSWLLVVDELVVIDGGSTDKTIEMIEAIGDKKIRIVSDEETKWEEDWSYSRMGKNFNRGYHECTGDIVVKFDIDYVLHEDAHLSPDERLNFKSNCEKAIKDNSLTVSFFRWNFIQPDRYFYKKQKTLAVVKDNCKKRNIPVDYGLDIKRWAWGYEPIVTEKEENGLKFGTLLGVQGNKFTTNIKVFNYGFLFSTKEQIGWIRDRHMLAECRQKSLKYEDINPKPSTSVEEFKKMENQGINNFMSISLSYIKRNMIDVKVQQHPQLMWEKLKNLKPEQAGYNLFGKVPISKYYK